MRQALRRNLSPIQVSEYEQDSGGQRALRVEQVESSIRVADGKQGLTTTGQLGTGCYVQSEAADVGSSRLNANEADVPSASTVAPGDVAKVLPFPTGRFTPESFRVMQRWEGTVTEITGDEFVARLRDLTDLGHPQEQAVFSLDEVDEDDLCLLQVGAGFYWSIGYHHQASGSRRLSNELRFRRLPQWTPADLEKLSCPSELDELFGGDD
jgi:hypothetical protein